MTLLAGKRSIQQFERRFSANGQRNDRARKNDHIPDRQDRQNIGDHGLAVLFGRCRVSDGKPPSAEGVPALL